MYLYVNNVQNYQFSNSTLPCRALILLHRDSNSRQHTEHQNKGQGISRNACDITDWSPKQMFDQIGASVKWRTQFMFIYQYLTSYENSDQRRRIFVINKIETWCVGFPNVSILIWFKVGQSDKNRTGEIFKRFFVVRILNECS